jgi:hypothetical protein
MQRIRTRERISEVETLHGEMKLKWWLGCFAEGRYLELVLAIDYCLFVISEDLNISCISSGNLYLSKSRHLASRNSRKKLQSMRCKPTSNIRPQ